jgi:hypothetical protein
VAPAYQPIADRVLPEVAFARASRQRGRF